MQVREALPVVPNRLLSRLSQSPLAPVLRGEGLGVRAVFRLGFPLTPSPSPRSTGARGTGALQGLGH